jgi:hypothetical protein
MDGASIIVGFAEMRFDPAWSRVLTVVGRQRLFAMQQRDRFEAAMRNRRTPDG